MITDSAGATRPARWARPFFAIWTGQAFSLLGSMLVQFALVWWLTQRTGSGTVLATATLVAVVPGIFIGPLAGALVDRWNRRLVLIFADGGIALITLGLAILALAGRMEVWHIYVVMFLRATLGGFHWPAMQASTSLMVPGEQLSRVAGLNQTLQGAMNIVAPPLGAVLLGILPLWGILAIDVVTACIAIAPLFFVPIPQPVRQLHPAAPVGRRGIATGMLSDLRAGLRYVAGWPGLLGILLMAMAINFVLSPSSSLMPLLVTKHFAGGALQLGWLESALGIGTVAGGLLLSAWGGFRRRVVTSLSGVVGIGVGIALMGLAPANGFWLALGGMFIAGFMNPIANGPLIAVLQASVAPEMQGRVMSLVQSGATAMMPLSLLVAGPLADLLGVRIWYLVGGLACAGLGLLAFTVPPIMRVEENGHKPAEAAVAVVPGASEL